MRMSISLKFNSKHFLSNPKIFSFFFVINPTRDQLSYLYTHFFNIKLNAEGIIFLL